MTITRSAVLAALCFYGFLTMPLASGAAMPGFDAGALSGLGARNIGSAAMSGRISSIAASAEKGRVTLYVGAASGGVWKSSNGGTSFKPVFDRQAVQSIGSIAVDPSNAKNVWVGTGEAWTRNSVSVGDGIYKSTDGGESWTNMGLPESERVTTVLVHPRDGNTVYACVPGKLWSDSAERGLYKTSDGGKTWAQVLKGANLSTGCASVAFDPANPERLLATLWDFRRKGWSFRSGGDGPEAFSGSGLYESVDGGSHWAELDQASAKGLPAKPWGRAAIAFAPSNPGIVYAVVEAVNGGLYRSEDGGKTWQTRDKSQFMVWRPFYFSTLFVDPKNPDKLFKPDGQLIVSDDGGKSFAPTGGGIHGDWHAMWINPENSQQVIAGNDGGLALSGNGGSSWVKNENLPVSQFYHVSVDGQDPYRVYGGLQDNSSWVGDSSYPGGIGNERWENMYGGDGFWVFADPTDADYLYAESQGGNIGRVNRHTHEVRDIQPKARKGEKLRYNWNTPIALSPSNPRTLYLGSQFLNRSRDQGRSWQRISPDLTTNDPAKQKQEESGGITVDNSAAEMHTTIYAIAESPKSQKLIWVGTDDGNLQITRDDGLHWRNVAANVPGLPANSWVSSIEASPYAAGTAYVTFDRHSFGDLRSYLYKTSDYGQSWVSLLPADAPVRGYAHVIREDIQQPGLLFLGTEFGLWISVDGGSSWAAFKGADFPGVAVRDLAIQPRDNDLVIATHGRGIWIVDDLAALRALSASVITQDFVFLPARPQQQRILGQGGWANGDAKFVGQNAPGGAVISYYQRARHLFGEMKMEVLDAQNQLITTLPAGKRRGINRVEWDMRVTPPTTPPAAQLANNSTSGARVPPGAYRVRVSKGGKTYEQVLNVVLDRRASYTVADRRAQFAAAQAVSALFGRMSALLPRINSLREAAGSAAQGLAEGDALKPRLTVLANSAELLKKKIVATKEGGAITGEERLREHTDQLYGAVAGYEGAPAAYLLERTRVLESDLADVEQAFAALSAGEVKAVNELLKARQLPPLAATAALPTQASAGSYAGLQRWANPLAAASASAFGLSAQQLEKD